MQKKTCSSSLLRISIRINVKIKELYRIEYTKEEVATWDEVYARVFELLPGRASAMHRKYLAIMEAECGYGLGQIPQLEDVSNFLKRRAIG